MKGHIKERSPGRWAIVLDVKDPQTGDRKRKWFSFAGTKRGAETEKARLITEIARGNLAAPSRGTLLEFGERWLADLASKVSARTHQGYAGYWRRHIAPQLGSIALTKLTPQRIATFQADLLSKGRMDGTGGLDPQTVKHIHVTLRKCLRMAEEWRLIPFNPAAKVGPPRVPRKPMKTADADDFAETMDRLDGHPMRMPVILADMAGLRLGEVCALQWSAIDLDVGMLRVVAAVEDTKKFGARLKAPKSDRARVVTLPGFVVAELRRHRIDQAEALLAIGTRQTDDTFVCGNPQGEMQRPTSVSSKWSKQRKALSGLNMHAYRHSAATQLFAAKVPAKVISERLGHASTRITMDVYAHVSETMQAEAASVIDDALRDAMARRKK